MSTVDASIPLQAVNQADPAKLLSLAEMAQQVQQNARAQQSQNALRQIFTQPGALDPNGNPTAKTLQATMAVDPKAGMELRQSTLQAQAEQWHSQLTQTQVGRVKADARTAAEAAAVAAYDEALKAGKGVPDATSAASRARLAAANNSGGALDENEIAHLTGEPLDIEKSRTLAKLNPDYVAQQTEQKKLEYQGDRDKQADKAELERERHDRQTEYSTAAALAVRQDSVNPTTQAFDAYLRDNPNATPQQQAQFLQTLKPPRSGVAMELQKWQQEHPNATDAETLAHLNSVKFDQAGATTAGRRQGNLAQVEEALPGLIDNALDASSKVRRGSFVPLNKLLQTADTAISDPDMLQFKIANQGVSSELQQLIARGGSNVTALKEAMELMNTAQSHKAYEAGMEQVKKELKKVKEGSERVRDQYAGGAKPAPKEDDPDHPSNLSDADLLKALGIPGGK